MVVIDGKGLNGEKADAIELYTRAAKILGQIKAETLQVTTGANVIDAKSGTVAAIKGSGFEAAKADHEQWCCVVPRDWSIATI